MVSLLRWDWFLRRQMMVSLAAERRARFLLKIDIREGLSVVVAHDEARPVGQFSAVRSDKSRRGLLSAYRQSANGKGG